MLDGLASGDVHAFEQFIDIYCGKVFAAAGRLSGMPDAASVEAITVEVFHDLWTRRKDFAGANSPGPLIFKSLVREVLQFLKQAGREERIRVLEDILVIGH